MPFKHGDELALSASVIAVMAGASLPYDFRMPSSR